MATSKNYIFTSTNMATYKVMDNNPLYILMNSTAVKAT